MEVHGTSRTVRRRRFKLQKEPTSHERIVALFNELNRKRLEADVAPPDENTDNASAAAASVPEVLEPPDLAALADLTEELDALKRKRSTLYARLKNALNEEAAAKARAVEEEERRRAAELALRQQQQQPPPPPAHSVPADDAGSLSASPRGPHPYAQRADDEWRHPAPQVGFPAPGVPPSRHPHLQYMGAAQHHNMTPRPSMQYMGMRPMPMQQPMQQPPGAPHLGLGRPSQQRPHWG